MRKIIMIDAFKPEYLEYAPYLKSLTKGHMHGRLKVPAGFVGGMDSFFHGKSNIIAKFKRDKKSSLKWTRHFTFLGKWPVNILINLIRLAKNEREFFLLYNIPLNKLHYFDTAVKKPLHHKSRVGYIRIGELDSISHKYGTRSRHTINCIKRIDKWLEKQEFDVVFSDHGMMDIKETINVPHTEICFIDGCMARYWGKKPLIAGNKGRWIKGNKEFGDYVFLAKPGILIFPNYWDIEPSKGMHGYDGKFRDMDGFYIIKKDGKRRDMTITELGKIVKQL